MDTLHGLSRAASASPNLKCVTVSIFSFNILQRNVYCALFRLLSTLPLYDEIESFSFIWTGAEESFYNDYHLLPESDRTIIGLYNWTTGRFPKAQELLGPLISDDVFFEKMREIRLPKNLRSFRTDMDSNYYFYLLPVLCSPSANITDLHIHKAAHPFAADFAFPTVKNLTISMASSVILHQDGFKLLKYQFPNLESLRITKARWEESISYIFWFPNVPTILYLDIPWPGPRPHKCRINALEHFLGPMLHEENARNLERCTFRGKTFSVSGLRDVVAVCTISKGVETPDGDAPGNHKQIWTFDWEGDLDFDQMERDWEDWEVMERQEEDLEYSDYALSESEESEHAVGLGDNAGFEGSIGDMESEFSGDSEYPHTGDELYPIDSDNESDGSSDIDIDK
ncbi:hypothetical protein TWF481_007657 [Arthrobotrys musiformis]|uniref:HNH nuclease domain-containing protein n=1 Tax=Arthrobotrys musiformis TaxID=47236 RepID=A0AAV9WDE6_9PEZI